MVNFDTGLINANDSKLSYKLKKVFNRDEMTSIKSELKSISDVYPLDNVYIIFSNRTVFITGFKKQDLSLNNCTAIILEYTPENVKITESDNASSLLSDELLSFILVETFIKNRFERLIIEVPGISGKMENILLKYGFSQNGLIPDRYSFNNTIYSSRIFSIDKKQFDNHSTGYFSHAGYNLKIRATNNMVISIESQVNEDYDNDVQKSNKTDLIYSNKYKQVNITINQIWEYFNGDRFDFNFKILLYNATEFQKLVWNICMGIKYGQTLSYENISEILSKDKKSGKNNYSRAVGTALSKNPVLLAIPCHRVIGKDGKLRGFSAGIEFKDYLLNHELENVLKIQ